MSSTATTMKPLEIAISSPVNVMTLLRSGSRRGGEIDPVLMLRMARMCSVCGRCPGDPPDGRATVNALTKPSTPDTVPATVTLEGVTFMCK